jgi:superfamily I DNA/RNA helicase
MESIALQGGKDVPDASEKDTVYYRETLPQLFTEAFIDLEIPPFEVLILDEAQDLMTETYLDVFDIILEGGINEGSWYFFLDAEKQNLYHASMTFEDIKSMLKNRKSFFTVSSLTDNCRNSVAIIEKLDAVFGTKTKHRSADERGADVEIKTYKKTLEQGEELEKLLRTLEREGVSKSEITILSPLTFKNSVAMQLDSVISASRSDKHIFFSTIQAFKGLESPVIILTDIESLDRESQKHLLYVGMTRAKTLLYILANKTVSKYLIGS